MRKLIFIAALIGFVFIAAPVAAQTYEAGYIHIISPTSSPSYGYFVGTFIPVVGPVSGYGSLAQGFGGVTRIDVFQFGGEARVASFSRYRVSLRGGMRNYNGYTSVTPTVGVSFRTNRTVLATDYGRANGQRRFLSTFGVRF